MISRTSKVCSARFLKERSLQSRSEVILFNQSEIFKVNHYKFLEYEFINGASPQIGPKESMFQLIQLINEITRNG